MATEPSRFGPVSQKITSDHQAWAVRGLARTLLATADPADENAAEKVALADGLLARVAEYREQDNQ